ncbi:cupin domain-containing protein [Rufibacter psychrotolerans]|uniref:cupin domain-containing protein n=1 Tax=Rufibacter psychrotolerans TaxID=2812556 RepID=UPI001966D7B5|nr:cupin domain-containing protein [Rufibacter sp. SYSU D00308]
MKTRLFPAFALTLLFGFAAPLYAQEKAPAPKGYVLEQDAQVAKKQAGPHKGGGETVAYSFFEGVPNFKTAFRKRVLKPGASIGYHLQKEDEIYYILSGTGQMQMNGTTFPVKPGDAILTRPGSSHGLSPDKDTELTLLIVYEKK